MKQGAESAPRAEAIVTEVELRWGDPCASCGRDLVGHDVVLSLFMGRKDGPRCAACLARDVGREPDDFLRTAAQNVRRLDCYRAGWAHSDRRLAELGAWPSERVPADLRMDALDEDGGAVAPAEAAGGAHLAPDAVFDAHDTGCGDLVLELRVMLRALAPGAVLQVRAIDPGAPVDLPAWCRVTRNALVHQEHPLYWIRRRAE